jgi:hypothetical protein
VAGCRPHRRAPFEESKEWAEALPDMPKEEKEVSKHIKKKTKQISVILDFELWEQVQKIRKRTWREILEDGLRAELKAGK